MRKIYFVYPGLAQTSIQFKGVGDMTINLTMNSILDLPVLQVIL